MSNIAITSILDGRRVIYTLLQILFHLLGRIYSSLRAGFQLERRLAASIIQIFIPATSIVAASWTSFFLHKNCVSARVCKLLFPLVLKIFFQPNLFESLKLEVTHISNLPAFSVTMTLICRITHQPMQYP